MGYYRHLDLDTRLALKFGEWRARPRRRGPVGWGMALIFAIAMALYLGGVRA